MNVLMELSQETLFYIKMKTKSSFDIHQKFEVSNLPFISNMDELLRYVQPYKIETFLMKV